MAHFNTRYFEIVIKHRTVMNDNALHDLLKELHNKMCFNRIAGIALTIAAVSHFLVFKFVQFTPNFTLLFCSTDEAGI